MSKHSRFVWHDYNTPDVEGAKRFYGELLGWHFFQGGGPEYQHVQVGERNIGGIMKYEGHARWLGYVAADNVDEVLKVAEHAGGKLVLAPNDLPQVGRFAILADPQGGMVAPFHHITDHGAPDLNDPPALSTVAWNELTAPVGAAAAGFYAKVFDWSIERVDMGPAGPYRMLMRAGEKTQAGDDKSACRRGRSAARDARAVDLLLPRGRRRRIDRACTRPRRKRARPAEPAAQRRPLRAAARSAERRARADAKPALSAATRACVRAATQTPQGHSARRSTKR